MSNKKAQSEMVGFAIILIIITMLILGFLVHTIKKDSGEPVESYQVETFIQSFLEYTTECAKSYEPNYQSMRNVLIMCTKNQSCLNGESSCETFKKEMDGIMENSWFVGLEWPTKGYSLNITHRGIEIYSNVKGNSTQNSRGATQPFEGGTTVKLQIYG